SCNQPLLAKRPSKIVGSVRNTISNPPDCGWLVFTGAVFTGTAGVPPAFGAEAFAFAETLFTGNAVFGTNPSCTHLRHQVSKSPFISIDGAGETCDPVATAP